VQAKRLVAWSIRNRVQHPSWWGVDWASVITKKWQYSSMTAPGDPNLIRWPLQTDTSWQAAMQVADEVFEASSADPSQGSTHYFDKSLDDKPPNWVEQMTFVMDCGNFHFYK
jgi:hypothetical protein